jgi:glucokinase
MAIIAIDLGGTKASAALMSPNGAIFNRQKTEISRKSGKLVCEIIQKQIKKLVKVAKESGQEVAGIGLSVPGIFKPETGEVWAPNIPGWTDYPLKQELQEIAPDIPIFIESDRTCYILGEVWQGNAKNCKNAIFLAVGTGIGAGILIDGKVLHGQSNIAGATGWMALNRVYRPDYERFGCFEYHASGDGLARVARDLINNSSDYYGLLRRPLPENITSYDVFEAYEAGDTLAITVINQAIEYWGMAAANYISIFNPEVIIFGGGIFGPAKKFIPLIREEAKRWAQPIAFLETKIEASKIGNEAGLYGAGKLALMESGKGEL